MRRCSLLFAYCACGLVAVCPCEVRALEPEWRSWTRGASRFDASLQGVDDGSAVLQSRDNRTARISLSELSHGDLDYIRSRLVDLVLDSLPKNGSKAAAVPAWAEDEPIAVDLGEAFQFESQGADGGCEFRSPSFHFSSPSALSSNQAMHIASQFEVVRQVIRRAPWGAWLSEKPFDRILDVQLYPSAEAFAKTGAEEHATAHFEEETGILHLRFEAVGLVLQKDGGWMFSHNPGSSGFALRELTLALLAPAYGEIPDWMLEGMAQFIRKVPVISNHAWPTEVTGADYFQDIPSAGVLSSDLSAMIPSAESKESAEEAVQPSTEAQWKMRLVLGWRCLADKPQQLAQAVIQAARNQTAITTYNADIERYNAELREFAKQPGVETLENGQYRYPADLVPPKPFAELTIPTDYLDRSIQIAELVLEGATPAEFASDALRQFHSFQP